MEEKDQLPGEENSTTREQDIEDPEQSLEPNSTEEPETQEKVREISPDQKEPQTRSAEDELLYLRAEFENYKKRMRRELDQGVRFANERFVRELTDIIDQFAIALTHGEKLKIDHPSGEWEKFLQGVEMTHKVFSQTLEKLGVTLIGEVGETFNPEIHEAISQLAVSDDKVDTVINVAHRGCQFHGRLVKPARVIVGIKQTE